MDEIWKPIKDFSKYEVSNKGRIRSFYKNRFMKPLILIPIKNGCNYYFVNLYFKGIRKTPTIHRLVIESFVGLPPVKDFVCNHKDGNKLNNNLSNLEWISRSDDANHAYRLGLRPARDTRGEKSSNAKLKNNEVRKIKQLLNQGILHKEIAEIFKVTRANISQISRGFSWTNITI